MTPTAAARLIDEVGRLWPRRVADGKDPHPWTEVAQDVYHKALCSASLDMSEEQALLAVRQLKAEGEYVPNDTGWKLLLVRLKAIANQGKRPPKPSPGSSEYQPEERHGITYAEHVKQNAEWIEREKARACKCDKGIPGTIDQPCLRCGGSFAGKWLLRKTSTASIGRIEGGGSK